MKNWFLIENDSWAGKIALLIIYLHQGRLLGQIRTWWGCVRVGALPKIPYKEVKQKIAEGKQSF